jgi:hypothetical protein
MAASELSASSCIQEDMANAKKKHEVSVLIFI